MTKTLLVLSSKSNPSLINIGVKATNIIKIAREVNIGLDSLVFIDDNPVERDRVKNALPEVEVPNWPKPPIRYYSELRLMRYFDSLE